MCEKCQQLEAEMQACFAEVEADAELSAYFQPDGNTDGWLGTNPLSDKVLAMFERMIGNVERWTIEKGKPEALSHGSPLLPMTASLVLLREVQMRRSLDQMAEAETFTL